MRPNAEESNRLRENSSYRRYADIIRQTHKQLRNVFVQAASTHTHNDMSIVEVALKEYTKKPRTQLFSTVPFLRP